VRRTGATLKSMSTPLSWTGRWWRLALLRLALAVPMAPWLIVLSLWLDSEWVRTAAFNSGRPAANLQTVLVIPALALLVLVIDALVAATLLRPWLSERIGLTHRAGLLFWRWLAASAIVSLLVAIAMRTTPGGAAIFSLSAVAGCGLFAAIVLARASEREVRPIAASKQQVAWSDALAPLSRDAAEVPLAAVGIEPVAAVVDVPYIERVSDPITWKGLVLDWLGAVPGALQRGRERGEWGELAAMRAEAAVFVGRGALPFGEDAADQLAMALDALRAADDVRTLEIACVDLLNVAPPRRRLLLTGQ